MQFQNILFHIIFRELSIKCINAKDNVDMNIEEGGWGRGGGLNILMANSILEKCECIE